MAAQAWELARLPLPRNGFSESSMFVNLHHLIACCDNTKIDQSTRRAFPWVLWNIWKARNLFFFEKTRASLDSLMEKAHEESDEWFMANSHAGKGSSQVNNSESRD